MLDDSTLKDYRSRLLALQDELRQHYEMGASATDTVELDQARMGRLSRMDALQQQKMAESSQAGIRRRLLLIARALERIDSGDFGYCMACDEEIAPARLQIQPETPLCLRCQSQREQG